MGTWGLALLQTDRQLALLKTQQRLALHLRLGCGRGVVGGRTGCDVGSLRCGMSSSNPSPPPQSRAFLTRLFPAKGLRGTGSRAGPAQAGGRVPISRRQARQPDKRARGCAGLAALGPGPGPGGGSRGPPPEGVLIGPAPPSPCRPGSESLSEARQSPSAPIDGSKRRKLRL